MARGSVAIRDLVCIVNLLGASYNFISIKKSMHASLPKLPFMSLSVLIVSKPSILLYEMSILHTYLWSRRDVFVEYAPWRLIVLLPRVRACPPVAAQLIIQISRLNKIVASCDRRFPPRIVRTWRAIMHLIVVSVGIRRMHAYYSFFFDAVIRKGFFQYLVHPKEAVYL